MRIIAGTARGRTIEAPKGRDTRPTLDRVRENLFNILQRKTWDAKVLDLFAGTGALSLEALSRGAAEAVLVDIDRAANACQKLNTQKLGFDGRTRILLMDWQQAVRQLAAAGEKFDLVFLDPPYAMHDMTGVMEALIPLLAEEATVIVEHEARVMPATADGYEMYDSRKYGYVGVSFFHRVEA
ncbi:MAG: 16S rRNA (guanine(966)-N(2))-methyltransferase RsmD [Clostridia bacterium]|nr:16S rRNA (guanine(966)-N(2))-methyltransferase RsmD [Clostridia bacterium]